MARDFDEGIALIDRALALNPNLAMAWTTGGWARVFFGDAEGGLKHFANAMRFNPLGPLMFRALAGMAFAHFSASRYEEAYGCAQRSLRERPDYLPGMRIAVASAALGGRRAEAEAGLAMLLSKEPGTRLSYLQDIVPFRRAEDRSRWIEGLRRAGIPD